LLTLFGALPMYSRIARMSPHGQGSILILEKLFPRWKAKAVVLCLLGFAATDFVITITLSAADATAHMIENPLVPRAFNHPMAVTIGLVLALGIIFLKGFKEALTLAVVLVGAYLGLNIVVLLVSLTHIVGHPDVVVAWRESLFTQRGSPVMIAAAAVLLFPKLALGLSGFETGVAVMPLVKGDPGDAPQEPAGRIKHTIWLLRTAAGIMSVMLLASSFITTMLIPPAAFQPGGPADGRALAFLAHQYLGTGFGTLYDLITIAILWFAGASAMAGLLNLIPRYLPRYGMAPEWARATRPMVFIITAINILVTIIFKANVTAQGGAYATGVLVLMSSGAVAVAVMAWRQHSRAVAFTLIALVFIYTTITNIFERPEGIKIASIFILVIVATSLISRVLRSTELRVRGVEADPDAIRFIQDAASNCGAIRIIANRPDKGTLDEYHHKLLEARETHHLPEDNCDLFLEVRPGDASEFSDILEVQGVSIDGHRVLRCKSPAIPNAIAALLLYIRDTTGRMPHAYFGWTEGNPITYLLKFLAFGEGDTAPVTREVLRQCEANPAKRPRIHVG
ncbi:MAG TPA: hypothetical protein VL243_03390, partial [Vicinamibacterales bacterium]|nr:hypothetical protein [Vicinamibacterales bacterium]